LDAPGFSTSTAGAAFCPVDLANNSNSFILSMPTTGYADIKVTYATSGSGTGFTTHTIEYSTDGASFISLGTITGRNTSTFSLQTIDFSGIAAANNNSNFKLRVTVTGATGSSGNNRFDNIRVTGTGAVSKSASVVPGTDAAEANTSGTFTISLSQPAPAGGVTLNYSLSGTATLSDDYSDPQNGTLTITEGNSTATVTLNTADDAEYEGTETITLTLNNATNGYLLAGSTASINLLDSETPPAATVVINQVYGGGGNADALYTHDFIELYNYGNTPVSLNGWSVQYASANGSAWQVTSLTGSIPAHGFYLIQQAAGSGGSKALPAPDATGGILMAAGSGKVILSNSATALTGTNPTDASVIDKVGYGSANGFETASAPVLSNTTSATRAVDGVDTDNNSVDFVAGAPLPRNTLYTTTPPVIASLTPVNNHVGAPSTVVPVLVFDKPVQKGTGTITIVEDGIPSTMDVNSPGVVITNRSTVTINTTLAPGKTYSILITAGSFKDVYENPFAGIATNTGWTFTTYNPAIAATVPITFDFQYCIGSGIMANGFTQYSTTGAQVWDCTSFGKDASNGVQINGFDGETNVPNEDWLISPKLDLTGTDFPLLSFWSRTAFNGKPLQLKISTDYTGGDPALATWTDLNGKFPGETSNTWTESKDINLAAFKGSNVHIAFVYTSSAEDGARWTLDEIALINSATPPPPSLTVGTTDLQLGYAAKGGTSEKTFTFIGNDLVEDVTLTVTAPFLLSKDKTSYSSSITYSAADANDLEQTVWVRFAPTEKNKDFTGAVTVTTSSQSHTVVLKGTSINPLGTLEVVNWNVEWFGSPEFGPTNDDQQETNVKKVFKTLDADIYALGEVVSEERLARVVSDMPGYAYVIGHYGSHTNTSLANPAPLSEAQKLAFIYKTSVINKLDVRAMMSKGINTAADLSNPYYNDWSSGRFPLLMEAGVTLNCVTRNVKFVLVHAKANTSPTATSYARREAGAKALHDSLQILFPEDNVIILGDFNDDLDQSITAGKTTTSWSSFTTDGTNYTALTLPLSLAGKKSTVSHNDVIDHVVVSNEMAPYYMAGTASIVTDVTSLVSNYGSTTSDHYPVYTRYRFEEPAAPVVTACPADAVFCASTTGSYAIGAFTATTTCGIISYSYEVTGATERSGTGNDASGSFNTGVSTITWTATDELGNSSSCQTTMTVNALPRVVIPDAYALPAGTKANTVYTGYSPASSLTLMAEASGGAPDYTYAWEGGTNGASFTVSPTTATEYTVTVTDANGCSNTASKQVYVVDVRAGKNGDKVLICHQSIVKSATLEVSQVDAADHLAHGDQLGGCSLDASLTQRAQSAVPVLELQALPNPSAGAFTLSFRGGDGSKKIQLTVTDLLGRVVETRDQLRTDACYTLGSDYRRGIYFVSVWHNGEKRTLKLVKQ
jgi:hypothetical protein